MYWIFGGAVLFIILIIIVAICVSKKKSSTPVVESYPIQKIAQPPVQTLQEPKLNFREYPLSECVMTPSERKRFYTLTQEVLKQLDNHGIVYWGASGTLLGAVRHQDVIPWDDDVDLAVVYEQNNMIKVNAALEALRIKGHPCGKTESGIKILDKNTMSFPWIDLMMVELGDDNRYRQCGKLAERLWPQVNYNKDHIFPLRKMKFGPLMIWCPNQYEKVLDEEFGPNWGTHISFKASGLYDVRLIQANKNIPTKNVRDQIEHFKLSLPKKGTLVRLENVII